MHYHGPMTRPQRASLYVRLSRASEDSNTSLEGMIADMRATCARMDLTEVALHVDDGRSGGRRDRAEFHAWLDDARMGRADILLNPATDRLTREGLNVAASVLDVVEGKDPLTGRQTHKPVRLLDTKGLDSAHGDAFRMQFVIQAEVGRSERQRIKERSRDRALRIKAAGRWGGGPLAFGYQPREIEYISAEGKARKGYALEQNPAEARLLRECMSRILGGRSIGSTCRWLNEQGYPPHRAEQHMTASLRVMLLMGPPSGLAGDAEPIFSPAESAALRAKLKTVPGRRPVGGRRPSRLLSGLVLCDYCGKPLVVARRDGRAIYRCKSRGIGKLCAREVSGPCEAMDAYITSRVLDMIGDTRMTRTETVVIGADDLATVEMEIAATAAELAEGVTAELIAELQSLQSRRTELAEAPREVVTKEVDTGLTGRLWWAQAPLDDRRDVVRDIWPYISLKSGVRGARSFDTDRLDMRHGEPDLEYEAFLQDQ